MTIWRMLLCRVPPPRNFHSISPPSYHCGIPNNRALLYYILLFCVYSMSYINQWLRQVFNYCNAFTVESIVHSVPWLAHTNTWRGRNKETAEWGNRAQVCDMYKKRRETAPTGCMKCISLMEVRICIDEFRVNFLQVHGTEDSKL